MCFSAQASFTAAAVLLALGLAALRVAPRGPDRVFALVPVIFGLQQAVEGLVWLDPARAYAVYGYMAFSHVLWPAFIPWVVLAVEPLASRRRALRLLFAVGGAVALYFLAALVVSTPSAEAVRGHLDYDVPDPWPWTATVGYLAAAVGSLLLSSRPWVLAFGGACALAALVTQAAAAFAFPSVWCFFAAALSLMVVAHFVRNGRVQAASASGL